ncbi:SPOR domain-containing protein [Methyloligella solikamskensis]|uniref:SPOR domain-containing protein n=1 Tax=Methyloligella solikamskensis TaxID=1177756 RepID=A0ABW3JDL2_9HYPH
MSIKDQQAGRPGNAAHGQQGQRPAPRPRAATGLAAGSTMFARMPSYTPVTRAPEQAYPQDQGYETQPAPADYTYDETAQGGAYQGEQYAHHNQGYADPQSYPGQEGQGYPAQEGYETPQGYYQEEGGYVAEGYSEGAYAEQSYDQQGYDEQAYGQQPYQEQDYQGAEYGQAPQQAYQSGAYQDAGAVEDEPLDLGMEEAAEYAEQPPVEQSFEAYGDEAAQGYDQQGYDAQGYDTQGYDAYAPAEGYAAEQEQAAYSNGQAYGDQSYAEQPQDPNSYDPNAYYGEGQYPDGEYAAQDPNQSVQTYEAAYDGAPEIPLTYGQPGEDYQNADAEPQADADFMGTGGAVKAGILSKYMGRRSGIMLGGAVLGAIALGGALAFAYKQSGGGLSGEPPLITAENTPVKEAPDQPGGKEFPHKNKLIYDRLENGDQPEADRLVPRQEELALPNMPAQTDMPDMPELAANGGNTGATASADPDSGPRKVKTLTVRPDGSVDGGQATANADAAGAQSEPTTTASIEPQAQPEAAPAPATNQKYVVQVASKKDQTSALAAFADMQQKYPTLLANYRPMVSRVNLGDKGVWYRLQVGPMNSQADASQLCGQLKSQGLNDCLVMAQ